MMAKTAKEIFEKLAKGIAANPNEVAEINGSFQFLITPEEGPRVEVYVNLKDAPGLAWEKRDAECVIIAKESDFLLVYEGVIPGFKAVMSGKLKVGGRLDLAAKLGEVFEKAKIKGS